MNAIEARQEAQQRGFTHVRTHGGLIPLSEWNPYGIGHRVCLTWDCNRDDTMYDVEGGIRGIWRFETVQS